MNNTFSLKQISRAGNLDANLTLSQHKLALRAGFMEIKPYNDKLSGKELVRELGYSSSTLQRFRNDIKCKFS